jgi:Reverse transcriptase (RNA-dependent DNA polymerase)
MADLEYVQAYIDDLLITTIGTKLEHLQKLAIVLTRLQQAGLKVNGNKSWFAQRELEHLGYWITRNRIQPAQEKVAEIQKISAPTKEKELRRFIRMVNYYHDMWTRLL